MTSSPLKAQPPLPGDPTTSTAFILLEVEAYSQGLNRLLPRSAQSCRVSALCSLAKKGLEIRRSQGLLDTVLLAVQTTNQVWPRGMQAHELLTTGAQQTPEKKGSVVVSALLGGRPGVGNGRDLQSPRISSLRLWYGFCPPSFSRV